MDSRPNMSSKINDAMPQKMSSCNSNMPKEPTMGNPLFKDQKRVIKKMIVMDTSKLKGLGIESTIKNAMSKLEKGKHEKLFRSTTSKPTHASCDLMDPIIKREIQPNSVVSDKPTDAVIQQTVRPGVVSLKPTNPVARHIVVQSKYISPNPSSTIHPPIRVVKHIIRPTFPSRNSTNAVVMQSTSVTSMPSVPTTVVQTTTASIQSAMSRIQPMSSKSTIPIINSKPMHSVSIQNSLENSKVNSAKIVESQTIKGSGNNVLIKTEATVPIVASDGKKIKILSDVSLNDTKAKLLEIDKISSKNLKLTNVIKGTDESPSQAALHISSPITKPIMPMCSTSVPLKGKVDQTNSKNLKYVNVIKGAQESPSQTAVTASYAVSLRTTATNIETESKLKNLKFANLKGTETRLTQAAVLSSTSTSKPVIPMCSSSVSLKAKIDNTSPQKLKLLAKGTEESSSKSVIYISDSSSRPLCSKAIPSQAEHDISKNMKFVNVVKGAETLKSAIHISIPSSKPLTSLYSTTASIKREIDDISINNLNFTNVIKGTEQSLQQSVTQKYNSTTKTVIPQRSASSPFKDGSTKMPSSPSSDQQIEIMMPAKQKQRLTKRVRHPEPCPIDDKTTFQDALWAKNNPRTYERNNVKRLLSAKIMGKTRMLDEPVVHDVPGKIESEETISTDIKCEDQCDVTPVKCDFEPLVESKPVPNHHTPVASIFVPTADDLAKEPSETNSVTPARSGFYGFSNYDIVESASGFDRINSAIIKSRLKEAVFVDYIASDVGNESEVQTVECDNENWVLNFETGVLEENINVDKSNLTVEEVISHTKGDEFNLKSDLSSTPTPVNETIPMEEISLVAPILEDNVLDEPSKLTPSKTQNEVQSTIHNISQSPSKTPVTEDADDEISDIDLADRSKTKCIGGTTTPAVKNRRAILKSIELHRKAFNPVTTDEESEISLCVRPPRPKQRKYRHKQTVEQLKMQQNAHVRLLKRFNRGDSDCNVWDSETMAYFTNGFMDRIEILESQVKCCFDRHKHQESNVEVNSSLEENLTNVNPVTENSESQKSVKPSESPVNVNNQLNSVVACESPLHQPTLHDLPDNNEDVEGQSMVHTVTIQKDTFLVTEYDDKCDTINHQPIVSKVKLEKDDSSPKPSCSLKRSRVRETNETTRPQKRKRQSLVQMLAKCVDQNTLKSVILAHEKQKCDFSSSIDSDSESDSDELNDVVNQIFRTVCTIDLCDDDDETVHEDVLQYLDENQEIDLPSKMLTTKIDDRCENERTSMCPADADESQTTTGTHNTPPCKILDGPQNEKILDGPQNENIGPEVPEISVKIPDTVTLSQKCISKPSLFDQGLSTNENIGPETPETSVKIPDTVAALSETLISKPPLFDECLSRKNIISDYGLTSITSKEPDDTTLQDFDNAKPDLSNEVAISTHMPLEISNIPEVDSNSPIIFEDTDSQIEMFDTVVDEEVNAPSPPEDITKLDNSHDVFVAKEPERKLLKLRPFEEISSCAKPQVPEKEVSTTEKLKISTKLSFDEALTKVDSTLTGAKPKTKRIRKVRDAKTRSIVETKIENSIDDNQNESRQSDIPIVGSRMANYEATCHDSRSTKILEQTSKVKFSSVSINDDSTVGAIKIKIKIEKDLVEPNPASDIAVPILNNNPKINGIQYPSRSRKRKRGESLQEAAETATTEPIQNETIQKRPIFDYFDSPEILTTKRARKTKSYVDCEIPNIDAVKPKTTPKTRSTNQRTSNRKTNSKCLEQDDNPKLESVVDECIDPVKDAPDIPIIEPAKPAPVIEVPENKTITKLDLSSYKTGRGVKQPVLAPLDIADQYVCGNCKEEVLAKNWTKHTKDHYGLSWRVDVDPPVDMDNINSMGTKIINFMKKTNLRTLKCRKCDVEKKSAIGYLSHVEVCGLTPDEVKSKLVKCDYCPSMIRSCSVRTHQTLCSGLKRLAQKEKEANKEGDFSTEECYNDIGRAVRRSAQKAMSSFKDLGKAPETKIGDYVERVHKISNKQHRKLKQLLNDNQSISCVRSGCSFIAEDMTTMLNHFNTCVLINGETFYCNRCDYGPDSRDSVEEHIRANHSLGIIEAIDDKDFSDSDEEAEMGEESSESEGESGDESLERDDDQYDDEYDDDDDGWNDKDYRKKRHRDWCHNEVMLNNCLDRKVLNEHAVLLKSYTSGWYFHPALEWTQDFRDKHFSSQNLFPFASPNTFSILNSSLTEEYTPKVSMSNKFLVKDVHKYKKQFGSTAISKSDEWKSLKRFEATKEDNSIVLFTGGPILSMAWLPVPDDHLSQVLAVCCRNDPNEDILLNNTKQTKCLIQIWNFNKLKNSQLRQAQTPHLLYSIAYDYGPIIQMEFCPSGGFTEDRLGLLAVSSYDGHVDVLALPKNFTSDNSTIENLVFAIKPSLILCCDLDKPLGELLTKLVWSQCKGHTKLAAGYANGLVAIWNLKNLQSPHTCSKTNGIPTLLPTDLFFAAYKAIKFLEFHHDEKNEARWLVAGSHDRKVKFFDTHNVFIEISTTVAHSRIAAGCWPMHWTTFLFGTDNAYSLKVSGIVVKQPLDIGCRTGTFYSCIGSTCDISFNNWLNSYVFVTSYGDIHVGHLRQMLSGFADARRQRSILGYTDAVAIDQLNSKDKDAVVDDDTPILDEPQPSTSSIGVYEHVKDISYPSINGVVFCDFQNPLPAVTSPSYDKIRAPPMNTFNMVKVNRILFNPNVSAYKLYALGYECGFVRINQLLPK